MFYLITGAAASGKSTMIALLKDRLTGVDCHDSDELLALTEKERVYNLALWVEKALESQKQDRDFLLTAHSPLGELLSIPQTSELDGISAALLDCHDYIRRSRFLNRTQYEEWPLNMDIFCWASWQRMHAIDPQWTPHVIQHETDNYDTSRWLKWQSSDQHWQVKIIDSTTLEPAATAAELENWIREQKQKPNHFTPQTEWWK